MLTITHTLMPIQLVFDVPTCYLRLFFLGRHRRAAGDGDRGFPREDLCLTITQRRRFRILKSSGIFCFFKPFKLLYLFILSVKLAFKPPSRCIGLRCSNARKTNYLCIDLHHPTGVYIRLLVVYAGFARTPMYSHHCLLPEEN